MNTHEQSGVDEPRRPHVPYDGSAKMTAGRSRQVLLGRAWVTETGGPGGMVRAALRTVRLFLWRLRHRATSTIPVEEIRVAWEQDEKVPVERDAERPACQRRRLRRFLLAAFVLLLLALLVPALFVLLGIT